MAKKKKPKDGPWEQARILLQRVDNAVYSVLTEYKIDETMRAEEVYDEIGALNDFIEAQATKEKNA